jgi:hypothetical protein
MNRASCGAPTDDHVVDDAQFRSAQVFGMTIGSRHRLEAVDEAHSRLALPVALDWVEGRRRPAIQKELPSPMS